MLNNTESVKGLIYIPGFNSGPQSEKSSLLKQAFPTLTVASYDSWNPEQGYQQLNSLISKYGRQQLLLIGSSLGGFWAYQLAKQYSLDCLLINPCMSPEISLRSSIGVVENFYTHEIGVLTSEDLQKYPSYRFANPEWDESTRCIVLHEKGDEVIPYQESVTNFGKTARLKLLEGGNHRFAHTDVLINEIRTLL